MSTVRRRFIGLLVFSLASVLLVDTGFAQPGGRGQGGQRGGGQRGGGQRGGGFAGGGFGGRGLDKGTLLRAEVVLKELKATESQTKQLETLQEERRASQRDRFAQIRDLSEEERNELFAKLRAEGQEFEKKLVGVLSEKQQQRLSEIYIQLRGVSALNDETVAKELELSDDQKTKIRTALESQRGGERIDFRALRDLSDEERQAQFEKMRADAEKRRADAEKKALAVLDEIQTDMWELMQGEKVAFTARDLMGNRGGGGRGGFGQGGRTRGGRPGGNDGGRPSRPGRPDRPSGDDN